MEFPNSSSIGHLATFSFHETKNIISGEGGMLTINHTQFIDRAEVILEKGTNRAQFFRGEINKYGWMDIGSNFLPSKVTTAFLLGQLENLETIQKKKITLGLLQAIKAYCWKVRNTIAPITLLCNK
jgi:dTDP-4-amino-4,6-dideoxygalactose transaminase